MYDTTKFRGAVVVWCKLRTNEHYRDKHPMTTSMAVTWCLTHSVLRTSISRRKAS